MEFPRMVVRVGTQWQLESGRYDLLIVKDAGEMEEARAQGWHLDQYAAKAALEQPAAVVDDNRPPTREELEQKASQLGIPFGPRVSDKKLREAVEQKLKAA